MSGTLGKQSIHEYLAQFDDIPGTRVYTDARARRGYHLNQFAMSLMKPENRTRFKADDSAYLAGWPLTDEQTQDVLDSDSHRHLERNSEVTGQRRTVRVDIGC